MEGIQTLKVSWPWPSIRHVVLHQSSTSTYIPNFIQIEETFCGRTDGRTYGRTYGRTFFPSILLGRLSEVDLKINWWAWYVRSSPIIMKAVCHKLSSNIMIFMWNWGQWLTIVYKKCKQISVTRQAVLTIRATDWSTSDWSDQVYEQAHRMQLSI